LAQLLGAFFATGISWPVYRPAIIPYSGGALERPPAKTATASIFISFPQQFSTPASQVISVIQRTAILQAVLCALKDEYNMCQRTSAGERLVDVTHIPDIDG